MKITNGEMPDDFWNYLVNPIVGYYIKPESVYSKIDEKKYATIPQILK
tara:strand:+ start:1565 stop:1708 length:144 start_codon:yes stop_codon:yes gene_type:complete